MSFPRRRESSTFGAMGSFGAMDPRLRGGDSLSATRTNLMQLDFYLKTKMKSNCMNLTRLRRDFLDRINRINRIFNILTGNPVQNTNSYTFKLSGFNK